MYSSKNIVPLVGLLVAGGSIGAGTLFIGSAVASADTTDNAPQSVCAPHAGEHRKEGMRGMRRHEGYVQKLETRARILGMTPATLEAKLKAGERFESILNAQGFTRETFHEKMKEARIAELKELVAQNILTQEEMDERVARMEAHTPRAR